MRVSLLLTIIFLSFLQIAKGQSISSDYHVPSWIFCNQELEYTNFLIENTTSTEIDIPECNRNYNNKNYYAKFEYSTSGSVQVNVRFSEQNKFGMALYLADGNDFTELKCDIFDAGEAYLTVASQENPEGLNILVRLWFVDDEIPQDVGLCALNVSDPVGSSKLMTINTTTYTVSQLVTDVLVTGCLQASNVTFQGGSTSIGYFSNATPGLNFAEGIVMSTGSVLDAPGPNSSGSTSTITGSGSDPQLQTLMPGYTINDATVLQFDFVPASDVLEFQYVFGSEEYME